MKKPINHQVKHLKGLLKTARQALAERPDRATVDRMQDTITRLEDERSAAHNAALAAQAEVELLKTLPNLDHNEEVEFYALIRIIRVLDEASPMIRKRVLAMVDARYFDPPAGGAK